MGCDMVVALGQATGSGLTLFGQNIHRPRDECQVLRHVPGRPFALGETVQTQYLEVPQARCTCTVLGCQPPATWGYTFGVNEHNVVLGCASWRSILPCPRLALVGTDLVRLGLERSRSARQAFDVITDLLARHGQGVFPGSPAQEDADHLFLIADGREAFALEAAGSYWAAQEIQQVRAASDVAIIRQDWARLAPGLAGFAIEQGWWPGDGSKLDFVGALGANPVGSKSALRRWGRATYLLEQQNGHIDAAFLRRVLSDHYDGSRYEVDPFERPAPSPLAPGSEGKRSRPLTPAPSPPRGEGSVARREPVPLCQHGAGTSQEQTAASFIAALPAEDGPPPVIWCTFGPPCLSVHFPLFLAGALPEAYSADGTIFNPDSLWWQVQQLQRSLAMDSEHAAFAREELARLQVRFDQQCEEFQAEALGLQRSGEKVELQRLANSLMQSHVEQFEALAQRLLAPAGGQALVSGVASW
jgi:dipeptidase